MAAALFAISAGAARADPVLSLMLDLESDVDCSGKNKTSAARKRCDLNLAMFERQPERRADVELRQERRERRIDERRFSHAAARDEKNARFLDES